MSQLPRSIHLTGVTNARELGGIPAAGGRKVRNGLLLRTGVEEECRWARHVIGSDIEGLNIDMVVDYIRYLGNKRARDLQLGDLFEDNREEPQSMQWVSVYSNANLIKTDFFEARSTAYAKSSALIDDLDD